MRLIWINIIAIIIAISSLVVEKPSIQADFSLPSSLTLVPHFNSDILRNDSQQHQEKNLQIAQDFIAIVLIADSIDANEGFAHYLPLHNLNRQKEYFLLI
jgi:hypothetical protein